MLPTGGCDWLVWAIPRAGTALGLFDQEACLLQGPSAWELGGGRTVIRASRPLPASPDGKAACNIEL